MAAAAEGQTIPGCGGPGGWRKRRRLLGGPGAGAGDGLAMRGVCRARGGTGAGAAGDEAGGEYNQAWLVVERNNHGSGVLALLETGCVGARIYKQGGQAGWLTTSVSRPAVAGAVGCGAGGGAGMLSEQTSAGRVQELCALAERKNGSAGGDARRPGDGHGDRAGGEGGAAGTNSSEQLACGLQIGLLKESTDLWRMQISCGGQKRKAENQKLKTGSRSYA